MKTMKTITLLLTLLVTMQSCSNEKNENIEAKTNTTAIESKISRGLPLASQWIIEFFNENNSAPETKNSYITISSDLKSFKGNGSCNTMSGKIILKGESIRFINIKSNIMACPTLNQEQLGSHNFFGD